MTVTWTLYIAALAFVVLFVSRADCRPIIEDGVVHQSPPYLLCEKKLCDECVDGSVPTVRCPNTYYLIEVLKKESGMDITVTYDNSTDPSIIPSIKTICKVENVPEDQEVNCIDNDTRTVYTVSWNYVDASEKPESTGSNSYVVTVGCEAGQGCPVKG